MADMIRNTLFFGIQPNYFYGAEAMYVDGGFGFVGAEGDAGGFFVLAGKDKGKFIPFKETAGGISKDAEVGVELGRIDFSGPADKFTSSHLFGIRDKGWVSVSPGEFVSLAGAYAQSATDDGYMVHAFSIQISLGVTPLPTILSGGYNRGKIKKWGD